MNGEIRLRVDFPISQRSATFRKYLKNYRVCIGMLKITAINYCAGDNTRAAREHLFISHAHFIVPLRQWQRLCRNRNGLH